MGLTPDPDIHVEEIGLLQDLRGLEAVFPPDVVDEWLTSTLRFPCHSETMPEPTTLTMDDIREAMYKCGFPRPDTPGERCIRRLREMGFEMRVTDPKALFTISTA